MKTKVLLALAVLTAFALIGTSCDPGTPQPIVSSVSVSPATAEVALGGTQAFGATVYGTNNPSQSVTWSIEEAGRNAGTTISTAGLLSVSAQETLATLTVKATSAQNAGKSGTAIVTVYDSSLLILSGNVTISPPGAETGVLLSAVYSGSEEVGYQWLKDGIAIEGATGSTYTPLQAGDYAVIVSLAGYNPKTSSAVTVTGDDIVVHDLDYWQNIDATAVRVNYVSHSELRSVDDQGNVLYEINRQSAVESTSSVCTMMRNQANAIIALFNQDGVCYNDAFKNAVVRACQTASTTLETANDGAQITDALYKALSTNLVAMKHALQQGGLSNADIEQLELVVNAHRGQAYVDYIQRIVQPPEIIGAHVATTEAELVLINASLAASTGSELPKEVNQDLYNKLAVAIDCHPALIESILDSQCKNTEYAVGRLNTIEEIGYAAQIDLTQSYTQTPDRTQTMVDEYMDEAEAYLGM